MDTTSAAERWSVAPVFIVDDVVRTANYYRDTLGFAYDRIWGEPPSFCMVRRGGVVLMLSEFPVTGVMRPNSVVDPERQSWDAYVWVADADALFSELSSTGATIARGLRTQPYGCRDFEVEDCNGYRLCFGHTL
jgi:predicted enzyme related to lactoylglutathione lyase